MKYLEFGNELFISAPIRKNECSYELGSLNRGLKTQSKFYNVSSGSWNLQRTETYGYDANRDFLTSANYGDGLANATPSWTYDDAGNRSSDSTVSGSWTYDNLNRMTASPGYTYINTLAGNRLEKTGSSAWVVRHSWDVLNRMTQHYVNGSNDVQTMTYRADGLRVAKANAVPGNNAHKITRYRYDGKMCIEDVEKNIGGTYNYVSRYAVGARGIDAVARTTSSGTAITYPIYDAHGNNIGLISKSGSSWAISDERSYDVWGQVRSGGSTGDQKGRYAASLGHKQDDESGLIYMKARYYEPSSGRFISEDSAMDGTNYYVYCGNNPINFVDADGKKADWGLLGMAFIFATLGLISALLGTVGAIGNQLGSMALGIAGGGGALGMAAICFYLAMSSPADKVLGVGLMAAGGIAAKGLIKGLTVALETMVKSLTPLARVGGFIGLAAAEALTVMMCAITGALIGVAIEEGKDLLFE